MCMYRGRREKGGINGLSDDEKHNTTKKYSRKFFFSIQAKNTVGQFQVTKGAAKISK